MNLPNLIGCGAGKSGTTSLYYYLSQHPQIYMAAVKEVHFFSRHFDEGIPWYESYFSGASNKQVIGEFSTSYMSDTAVPQRIASLIPNTKLLFIFRNPIERAYSNYWFSVSIGNQIREETFSDVIRTDTGHQKYLHSGFYYQHLDRFLRYFSPEQIHIIITEEFKREPIQQMSLCYEFLDIDATFRPDVDKQYNITLTTKSGLLGSIYSIWATVKKQIKPTVKRFPVNLRSKLAEIEKQAFKKIMSDKRSPMSDEDRLYLLEIFAKQNKQLIDFIGRDIPDWK